MPSKSLTIAICLITAATGSSAAQSIDEKRALYAMIEAVPEYCPTVEQKWFVAGAVDYDMSADGEVERYNAERKRLLQVFRTAGPRVTVCESIMEKYGPGAETELFQYK